MLKYVEDGFYRKVRWDRLFIKICLGITAASVALLVLDSLIGGRHHA